MEFVHLHCLRLWLEHSGRRPPGALCEVCLHPYDVPLDGVEAALGGCIALQKSLWGLAERATKGLHPRHMVWVVVAYWCLALPWLACVAWSLAVRCACVSPLLLMRGPCAAALSAQDSSLAGTVTALVVPVSVGCRLVRAYLRTGS